MRTVDRPGRAFVYHDLDDLPNDGHRYELSDGSLLVTPAPNTRHQAILMNVAAFLHAHAPASRRVLPEAELFIRPDLVKRPDVMVVAADLVGGQYVTGTPDLVVEIHSPATRRLDLTEKRAVYADAGIGAYWLIDPEGPTLTVLELAGAAYTERAVLVPGMQLPVTAPFAITLDAADILA